MLFVYCRFLPNGSLKNMTLSGQKSANYAQFGPLSASQFQAVMEKTSVTNRRHLLHFPSIFHSPGSNEGKQIRVGN